MSWVVRLIVVLPALAGLVGLLTRRSVTAARVLAVGSATVVTALALAQWISPAGRADIATLGGLQLRDLGVPLHLLSDPMSGLIGLAVALVVLAIQVFTVWYLREDPRYAQFAASVSLFAAGMLLVVQSADLVLTLVGWEIMGWCSWLLIGHDSERAAARRAAYKAFIVTRIADIAMVVGLIALSVRVRTTDLTTVLAQPAGGALIVGLVGVIIGVAGKSGLIPFHDWLPDAMEGPTPASALIHAATMVAAGSYVIARLFTLYVDNDAARTLLAVLAAATMVYAAGLAFAQSDLKRLLAYSTLSQVAIMLGALAAAPVAVGVTVGVAPGMGHLVSHAFFKALLFLGAGWLAALVGATSLVAMRGRLRPTGALRWAMGIGLAALAGVPPLIGFFTKDTVVDAAFEGVAEGGGWRAGIVVLGLLLTVVLTAAYCTRAWLLIDTPARAGAPSTGGIAPVSRVAPSSSGEAATPASRVAPSSSGEAATPASRVAPSSPAHHGPITLSSSLAVGALTVLTVLGTFLLLRLHGSVHLGVASAFVSVVLIAAGAFTAFQMSNRGRADAADRLPVRVRDAAVRGFGADTAYVGVGAAVTAMARLVVALDRDVVDAYPRAAAALTRSMGRGSERSHRAVPSLALLGLVVGVVVIAVVGVTAWS